jgi:hypothetical protein
MLLDEMLLDKMLLDKMLLDDASPISIKSSRTGYQSREKFPRHSPMET